MPCQPMERPWRAMQESRWMNPWKRWNTASPQGSSRTTKMVRRRPGRPGAPGQFRGQISPYEAPDHTVRKLSSRSVRVSWFGAILTKILYQKSEKCNFFFEKVAFVAVFGTKSSSESPKTIKIKEISSRAFERCGREPHTTRSDPSYGLAGWLAGQYALDCCFSTGGFV